MISYCQMVTQKYQELLGLKAQFDLVYPKAIDTGDFSVVKKIKTEIEGVISYLKESTQDPSKTLKCLPEQIAHNQQEITPDTKAYIGPLYPNIFKSISHIDHIYTSFPDGIITKETITVGGKPKEQLVEELKEQKIKVMGPAESFINSKDFSTSLKPEQADFVRLSVKDLFDDSNTHTTDEVCAKAEEFGLELCCSQDGPSYRLHYKDQPLREWTLVGVKQISDAGGTPGVFVLVSGSGGLEFNAIKPGSKSLWEFGNRFVFRLSPQQTRIL